MRLALLVCLLPLPALAEPLSRHKALPLLFPPDGSEVSMTPGVLPEDKVGVLATATAGQPYYGAIALSPSAGLMSEMTVAAVNHHTLEFAERQALIGCTDKGGQDCRIAAVIVPAGWEPRAIALSSEATRAVATLQGALAISPTTGRFGTGATSDAALAACGAADCVVVIAD